MTIGYARISTMDQNLEYQLDELKKAGCEQIFTDKITGTKFDRPQLTELKKILRKGDTIVVWKIDRMGRGLRDMMNLMKEFETQGINFKSLTEPIDTTTATGRLVFSIFATMAEFERSLIVERTQAGLKAGRARGKVGGRPSKLTPEQKVLVRKMHADKTIPISTITDTFKITRQTMYKALYEKVGQGRSDKKV